MDRNRSSYWGYEEDKQLMIEYTELYMSMEDIARIHERTVGAITSRIDKLELKRRKQFTMFVLRLTRDRYFVGVTDSPTFTLSYDYDYGGGEWLRKYEVEGFLEPVRRVDNLFDIDKRVKELMFEFGIERVRGGSYSGMNLSDEQIVSLRAEFKFMCNLRL
jgi:hypothetical protein